MEKFERQRHDNDEDDNDWCCDNVDDGDDDEDTGSRKSIISFIFSIICEVLNSSLYRLLFILRKYCWNFKKYFFTIPIVKLST